MACHNCGTSLASPGAFCSACGARRSGSGDVTQPARATNPLAIWSLVLGLTGLCLPAIITGHVARSQIRRANDKVDGKGLALAGLILGYSTVVLVLLAVAGTLARTAAYVSVKQRLTAPQCEPPQVRQQGEPKPPPLQRAAPRNRPIV
jgi:hypothetical protein